MSVDTLDGPRAPAARGRHLLAWEYTEEWAYESPTGEMMAALLRPGRERLLYFHVIARGRCWVAIEDGEPHWAEKGDVVVLPYGHQHQMGGTTETECVSVLDLMSPPPWTEFPVVRHGSGGERTDVICGYLDVDDPLFDPALRAAFDLRRPADGSGGRLVGVEPHLRAGGHGDRPGRVPDPDPASRAAVHGGSAPAPGERACCRPRLAGCAP